MESSRFPYFVTLFIAVVLQYVPNEKSTPKRPLENDDNVFNIINNIFNSHTTRIGTIVQENKLAVMKHLNRDNTIEKLLQEYCDAYSLTKQNCRWAQHDGSVDRAKEFITTSILDSARVEGCIFCPATNNRQSLQRFLSLFESTDNELWNLLAVRTNIEPLLIKLLTNYHDGPPFYVPKLLHTFGFSIIESYAGKTLEHYYDFPLVTRMRIAAELIKAAFKFTEGIHGFRVFLTDINPDNVVVNVKNDSKQVYVSIVDLDNVILLDSWAETFVTNNTHHVHSKIECNGCFAYVQEDVCRYQNSDLNLFATCQLLLENLNGHYAKGLLHYESNAEAFPVLGEASKMLQNLLTECVYCHPPDCQNRSHILKDMLHIIDQTIIQS
ncbi:uncharacterized protein LOC121599201 isoform X2 [Anopheles merus]|uniref:uncharacterized protein LOC121599201 isoform X2 n=1 Tax=Anopheles merus TaxID=30066 RepID=UPI001BE3E81A|nr:uncharacterized protein LOC121599201 isoform X2 [Anopheles merus]